MTSRSDVNHDVRSDHDRLVHRGNQDRPASRVRPGGRQGGVHRPARHRAAGRLGLLRRLRHGRPAHRAGAERRAAGHDLTGGLLARGRHRGEAGRGDRRGRHREGLPARSRRRSRGGQLHRPRRERPRADSGQMRTETHSPALNAADSHDLIRVLGARVNNLKDVSIELPKRRLTVFTGISGSGKSSLVFGTIAAESQRLINETYSAFVQGFMPTLARPEVDVLEGLTTAIIIDQERMGTDPRSTVGTATDANAMLRIAFSRLGKPHLGSANAFSFNVPSVRGSGAVKYERGGRTVKERRSFSITGGMCPRCEGRGVVSDIDLSQLFDDSKSLNEGAITVPGYTG